jgi:hypothetical protein
MAIKRCAPEASVAEVLDRVLDRGIVIDAWLRVSVIGINLIDVDARIVVASISTYVRESDAIAQAGCAARPATPEPPPLLPAPPAPRRPRRPRLTLQCENGCTFTRGATRCPVRVRCPSEHARVCSVAPLVAAVA